LDETGLAPEYLELEVTESLLLEREENISSQMLKLSELGLKMAIDDFGTGYSSFSYLKRFRFDRLKIDGSFMQALNTDPNGVEIAGGIIALGKILKMEVIAECAETAEQLETLRSLGCDQIQGYYFSRPLGAAAFAEKVRTHYASLPA
jgi:EAL domain-containing protein (putative c-di-GMP-specific phosphodiesterase class I)